MLRLLERSRRVRLVLVGCAVSSLALITLDARDPSGGPLDALGSGVRAVLAPVQRAFAGVARPIGNALSGLTQGGTLRARIETLERENAELRSLVQQIEDIASENEELRAQLGLPARLGLSTLGASVIAVGPSNFERVVVIDKGSADGLVENMPVLGNGGLAGRILRVTEDTADVLLIIDRSSTVASRLSTNGELGASTGRGGATIELELFDPKAKVAEGDRVVTSSYSGGLFPSGIPIGTVIAAPDAGASPTRRVVVRPAVDFSRVSFVFVVTGTTSGAPSAPGGPGRGAR